MSNAGQAVSGLAGAVIGYFVGGPTGAYWGFQAGYLAGTALFPTQLPGVQGPRLGDGQQTTSVVGQPIPWVFGTQTVGGNVIWASPIREVATTESVGGKGGPEQDQTTYKYYRSFAILLCEGPIGGIRRIWANGKLIYDRRPVDTLDLPQKIYDHFGASPEEIERIALSNSLAARMTVYVGTDDQMPDPVIESFEGAGNVPGYRGYAYVVFDDVELKAEDGNRIPASWKFEVYEYGDSDPVEVSVYSNEVLYPWVDNDYPLNQYDSYTYSQTIVADASQTVLGEYPSLTDAVNAAQAIRGADFDEYLGYSIPGSIPPAGSSNGWLNRYSGGPSAYASDAETIWMHYNVLQPTKGYFATSTPPSGGAFCSGEIVHNNRFVFTNQETNGAIYYYSTSGDVAIPPGFRSTTTGGGCWIYGSPDIRVKVDRTVQPPPDPAVIGYPSGVDGWYVVAGTLLPAGPWELDESTTYRVLQKYASVNGFVTKYPLNPARPADHPQYNDQEFWEQAYEIEVARGRMQPGLVYGVHYPVTQNFGYRKSIDTDSVDVVPVSIASIVSRICDRTGVDGYDVGELESEYVIGYQLARPVTGRSAIDPLRQVAFFDVIEDTIQLRFTRRGKSPAATLSDDDLGAHFVGEERASRLVTLKKLELELPRQIRVHFQNPERDYEPGEELSPARFDTAAESVVDIDLAVAINPSKAAQIAEVLYRDAWAARWIYSAQLDQSHSNLQPADCVLLTVDGQLERTRIQSIVERLPNIRMIDLMRDDDGAYISHAVGTSVRTTPVPIRFFGPVGSVYLDIPMLSAYDNDAGLYALAWPLYGSYRGATFSRSTDGVSFSAIADSGTPAVIGTVLEPVGDGWAATFDEENEVLVELEHGSLESRSEEAVLNGHNAAAIGGHGRWEIIQFKNATNVVANVWRLTGLLRGRRGTEHNISKSRAGDRFALLTPGSAVRLPLQPSDIGAVRFYKAVSFGTSTATGIYDVTSSGEALKPFSPVSISGIRDSNGDLTISWIRRGRIGQELRSGSDIPVSEETERYEIDILLDDTVQRTLVSTSPSVVYTASEMAEDFGIVPDSVTVRIYQLSASVGRGTPGEATV